MQEQTSTLAVRMDDAFEEHELKSHVHTGPSTSDTAIPNTSQKIIQYASELQKCILQDNIVGLSQKLTEISATKDVMIQSVLSWVFDEKTSSQTLLMIAIRANNVAAFDIIINQPVESAYVWVI